MYEVALEILKKINNIGYEAYIIGGYVRDKYLKINNCDIDICTSAKYDVLKEIFNEIEPNKYGSYKVKYEGYTYEITTFRKEGIYINNRFPLRVSYTKNFKKDLKRRDFIINTMCIDMCGNYVDLLNAKTDLDNKIVRLVGKKNSLKKDAFRILRAIRIATALDFKLEKKLEDGINKYKHFLCNISQFRKKQEIEKIFKSENVEYGCYLIQKFNLEKYLDIYVSDVVRVDNINAMWAQVLKDDSYDFSKRDAIEIKQIKSLLKKEFDIYDLYKYGENIFESVVKIRKEKIDIKKLYSEIPIKDRQDIDINFFEICEVVSVDNETISTIYDDIEKQIVYSNLKNKKSEIKKYIKKKYQKSL